MVEGISGGTGKEGPVVVWGARCPLVGKQCGKMEGEVHWWKMGEGQIRSTQCMYVIMRPKDGTGAY